MALQLHIFLGMCNMDYDNVKNSERSMSVFLKAFYFTSGGFLLGISVCVCVFKHVLKVLCDVLNIFKYAKYFHTPIFSSTQNPLHIANLVLFCNISA